MYLGVQFLSAPRNWGSWRTPGLWNSRTDTSLPHRELGYRNCENTSHFWSLQSTTMERFFFFLYPGKDEWLGVCQQYHSCTKSAPVNHLRIRHRDRHRAAAEYFWQPRGSSSCTAVPWLWEKFGPFATPFLSDHLIGLCTCSRVRALLILIKLRNRFTTEPLNLYRSVQTLKPEYSFYNFKCYLTEQPCLVYSITVIIQILF